MMNRKDRVRPLPISFDEAVAQGMIRVITDPEERAKLEAKERYDVGYNQTARNDSSLKYSDTVYFADCGN